MIENTDKKLYELSYFISPDITDEEALTYSQKIKDMLDVREGEVGKEEAPFKRKLAYPIKHKKQGYFGWIHFLTAPGTIKELGKKFTFDPMEQNEVHLSEHFPNSPSDLPIRVNPNPLEISDFPLFEDISFHFPLDESGQVYLLGDFNGWRAKQFPL